MVTALKIEPNLSPYPCQICDNGEYLNHIVSPSSCLVYTAAALKLENNIAAIYCRNGHLFSLSANRRTCGGYSILTETAEDVEAIKQFVAFYLFSHQIHIISVNYSSHFIHSFCLDIGQWLVYIIF